MGIDLSEMSENQIYEEMLKALLRNFWLAIYENKLNVTIGDYKITRENLYEAMILNFPDEHDTAKKIENYNPRPFLETVMHADEDKNHVLFKCDLNQHPDLSYMPKIDCGTLLFYAWKTKHANNRIIYMRKPRMLVYGQRNYSGNGYYGVFVCTDGFYNELLRMIENPAHNEWNLKNNQVIKKSSKSFFDVYGKFVDECIKTLFNYADTETLSIKGLDQYLYIPTDVENEDDDDVNESLLGDPTGILKDEGNSHTSTLSSLVQSSINNVEKQQGRVMVKESNVAKRSSSGVLLSGHSNKKVKHKGGGIGSKNPNDRNEVMDGGTSGAYLSFIPVNYRAFAITKDGKMYHNIIINSDYDVERGEIQIMVGGDDSIGKINLLESSHGTPVNNTITDVQLKKGKNSFLIRFVDKMKHSIKIEAYEIK